jgi:hypothetical protein
VTSALTLHGAISALAVVDVIGSAILQLLDLSPELFQFTFDTPAPAGEQDDGSS